MEATYLKYLLQFKRPSGTSRGVLLDKETFILTVSEQANKGIGECAVFRGLSFDDRPDYEENYNGFVKTSIRIRLFLKNN